MINTYLEILALMRRTVNSAHFACSFEVTDEMGFPSFILTVRDRKTQKCIRKMFTTTDTLFTVDPELIIEGYCKVMVETLLKENYDS